jgi:exopolysaccharide biosynthesis polyprenyl glycosylphosphotransferase
LLNGHGGSVPRELARMESAGYAGSPVPAVADIQAVKSARAVPPQAAIERNRFRWAARDAVYRRFLACADTLAASCALLVSIAIIGDGRAGLAPLVTVPLILVISKLIGTYDREDLLVRKSTLDEAPALFQLATLYALIAWLIDGELSTGARGRRELLVLWAALFLLLLAFRTAARSLSRLVTEPERCLVIGDAATCVWVRLKFARRSSLHASVVGIAATDALETLQEGENSSVRADDLQALVEKFDVDRIIITPGSADQVDVIKLVHSATSLGLKVSVLPRVLEVVGSSVEFDDVEGVPLLSMRPPGLSRSSRLIKRLVDVVGASVALLILGPVLAVIVVVIRLDSRGPVFFRQRRIGRDGQAFELLKFRSMVHGADERQHELRHLNEAEGLFKIAADPRITRVGKVLRRASLDELPQLLNVVRGEMSLVGPRPLVAEEDSRIEGWHRRRLNLTPGMTGHWQVLGSARIPLDDMVRIDYLYVTSWSLWLDVKILLRTIPYVFAGKGL